MKQLFTFMCLRGHQKEWMLEANEDGSPIYEILHGREIKPLCLTCHLDNRQPYGINIESESMAYLEKDKDSLTESQCAQLRNSGEFQTKWQHPSTKEISK